MFDSFKRSSSLASDEATTKRSSMATATTTLTEASGQDAGMDTSDDSYVFGLSDPKKEAMSLLGVRNAAAVAVGSIASNIAYLESAEVERYARLTLQLKELECCILSAEHAFLDKMLMEVSHHEKLKIVFDMIDKDGNGIDTDELAEAFRRIHGVNTVDQVLPIAEKAIETFGGKDAVLSLETFERVVDSLTSAMECTFNEVLYLMISKIAFSENGRRILEEFVSKLVEEDVDDDGFDQGILQARMMLVFDTMDYHQDGTVSFQEVVKHLSRFTAQYLNPEQRNILLMVDSQTRRNINREEFTELILNIAAAAPNQLQFHEIANAMTLSICRQDVSDDDIKELFLNREACETALADKDEDELEVEDILSFGKLNRLFDLLDMTKDGYLDVMEVALFFRKYQSDVVDMEETIKETLDAIAAVDQNGDLKLDRKDFSILVTKLAHGSMVEIHRFVDFLVVQTALKDNDEKDLNYLDAYRKLQEAEHEQKSSFFSVQSFMSKGRAVTQTRRAASTA